MSTIGFFGRRCFSNSATLFRFQSSSTHYDTLGVKPLASDHEIKAAYYKLACKHHPDKTGSTEALKFVRISDAYAVLRDERKRHAYDSHVFIVSPLRQTSSVDYAKAGFMAGGFSGIWCFGKTFKSGDKEYRSYEEYEKAEERRKSAEFDKMMVKYIAAFRVVQVFLIAWIMTKLCQLTISVQSKCVWYTLFGQDTVKRVEEIGISKDAEAESDFHCSKNDFEVI